jgi:hypothetical protein
MNNLTNSYELSEPVLESEEEESSLIFAFLIESPASMPATSRERFFIAVLSDSESTLSLPS